MNIKKIILIVALFFISGCSANYTVTVNEDFSIKEKVDLEIVDTDENYEKIKELFYINKISNKKYNISRLDDTIKVTYNDSFDNIEEYILQSKVYKQAFSEILLNKNSDKTRIETSANFNNMNISKNKDNDLNFDNLVVNVNSKLPILSSTADKINNNTYIWEYDGIPKEKDIEITFYNRPSMITYKSILIISLMIIISVVIGIIIYNRANDSNKM